MQAIELVERPKISPQPPLAIIRASAGKAPNLHAHQVLGDAAPAAARGVEHRSEKIPKLEFRNLAAYFPAPHLLVERVEQWLPVGRAGEGGAAKERAAEPPLVAETLGRAVEGDAQPVQEVDDPVRPISQFLDRRLVLQKIAAVNRVVEMLPLAVAELPREIIDAVDAPLAHALCERLTGSRLIRPTLQSSSASFMAAASPASPPPTIITRGGDMGVRD